MQIDLASRRSRRTITLIFTFILQAFAIAGIVTAIVVGKNPAKMAEVEALAWPIFAVVFSLFFAFKQYTDWAKAYNLSEKIQSVEAEIRANPDRPQLAWELAQTKLKKPAEGGF